MTPTRRLFLVMATTALLFALLPSASVAEETENVALVGQIGGSSSGVFVQGDYAYLGVGPRLVILDISDPTSPMVVGQSAVMPVFVTGVYVNGAYAYVTGVYVGEKLWL